MFVINFILWLVTMFALGSLLKSYPNSEIYELAFYTSLTFGIINIFFLLNHFIDKLFYIPIKKINKCYFKILEQTDFENLYLKETTDKELTDEEIKTLEKHLL